MKFLNITAVLGLITLPIIGCSKKTNEPVKQKNKDSNKDINKIYNFEIKNLQKVRFHFGDRETWPTTRLIEVNIKKEDNINLNEKLPEFKNLNDFTFKFIQSEFSNNKNKQDEIRQLITTYGTKVGKKEWVINKKITIKAQGTNLNDYKQDDNTTDYSLICTNDFEIENENLPNN
ncbi:hypothetical protein [Spiroplasma endosymbiont of Dilophus febrilis]|uniref:hypothetical protein n=1 Tax=Spiroplasma endosymbiont of Dilophus febrilis TaxID=3066292 RepID=UPI00313C35D8